MASPDPDIRELQVEVSYLKRGVQSLLDFRDETNKIIAERLGTIKRKDARGARLVRFITVLGGALGIIGAIGVIITELV